MEVEIIQKTKKLQAFCADAAKQDWLVIDTEFVREKTYYPNLCLIQIASNERAACIDTIAIDDLSPLKKLIYSSTITKVFHAASQDLEIFFNLYGDIPAPIFDTQIAASALGYGDQVSYAYLVKEICGVTLDKSLSRTPWDRRPLSDGELQYALDDVKYLSRIYQHIKKELELHKRSHWVTDEFLRLGAIEKYKINPGELWRSVKGFGKLESSQLIVLKFLAEWRDRQATQENKPRQWILRDKSLCALAIRQPTNITALSKIDELTYHKKTLYADSLIDCISKAQQTPKQHWPSASKTVPLNREQRKLVRHALQLIRNRAEELNIAPNLLATRSVIEKLIRGQRELHILQDWRQDLIGYDLVQLLENDGTIDVSN